ncbi:ABC transporter, transmembrane region:ABC transporter [Richelia intracellularis HH01]|uniref:ABC transporter, transmembrane region:ABC transporter n=1 Tax=Richelia intracellularis HH01 TaxID=1165094 RepID=M1X2Y0_9NOST|nr:ABC transporter, transmembrane region:ABC transporter [Richelia intracellularis HH01]
MYLYFWYYSNPYDFIVVVAKILTSKWTSGKKQKFYPFKRLFDYGQKYKRQLWLACGASVLNKLFDLAPPALIGVAVNIAIRQEDSIIAQLGVEEIVWQFLILSLVTVIIWVLESLFEYSYKRLWRSLAQNIQHNLRLDAYKHLQKLELAYFEEHSTGALISILSDDINQLERFLDSGINDILQVFTTVIIVGGAFFIIAPDVAWIVILPIPFIVWGTLTYQDLLAPRYADVREKVGLLNSRLSNNLSGITTIKSFVAEDYENQRLASESEAYSRSNNRAIKLSAAFIPMIRMLILVGFIGLMIFGGMATVTGKIAVSAYSVLVFLIQRLLWPLTRLGETFDQYQRAMASTNRVMDLLNTPVANHYDNIALDLDAVTGELEFVDISFSYQNRLPIIQNLSLYIPSGKTIAIVGTTGSGKSTLVKLLLRFYELNYGKITLDGIDIKNLSLRDLRQCIGLVSQDVFLFHGTVADNITYGSFNAKKQEIIMAAKLAEADDFIMKLPYGYETVVGERGQKLSGGQRQRIALARTILKNPPILVLDEATSAVDNETEAAIQRTLEKITVNRTTIVIAHRLSTIRNADYIYVMEMGKLLEYGTHERLLQMDGIYASLWQVQSGIK